MTTDTLAVTGQADQLAGLKNGFFSSTLSVDEFVLLHQAGFSPKGMVVGSSVYHVGIQIPKWNSSQEMTVLTEAMHNARELALWRMAAEAAELGADGVVGVKLTLQPYVGGESILEFVAVGTAISYDAQPGRLQLAFDGGVRQPFTSDLNGRDFIKLWRSGFVPTHLSFGVCVYHIAHQGIRQSLRQVGANIEMDLYTQAVYSARELAMDRLQKEGVQWGSIGVVGTRLLVANYAWGEHATEFLAIGTGVRRHEVDVAELSAPAPVLAF